MFGDRQSYYNLLHAIPIDINEYEAHDGDRLPLTPGTNAATIMQFLSQHPEQGFTPKEIHEATDVKRGSVGVVLHRLEKRDLVRHIDQYWTLGEDEDLATYAGMYHSMDALNDLKEGSMIPLPFLIIGGRNTTNGFLTA